MALLPFASTYVGTELLIAIAALFGVMVGFTMFALFNKESVHRPGCQVGFIVAWLGLTLAWDERGLRLAVEMPCWRLTRADHVEKDFSKDSPRRGECSSARLMSEDGKSQSGS